MIPIQLKLKRRMHKDIAYAQDLIVETLYTSFPGAVIHGGTAIWRCYQGSRFSEDIDVYLKKDSNKIAELFSLLEKKGFQIMKKRVKENSLYSTLKFNDSIVRFEALFKNIKKFIIKEYETSEGILINVLTLNPEELIKEKICTYLKRKKIRDLYDIFFLLRYVQNPDIKNELKNLMQNYKEPIDEQDLKTILISGPIPTSDIIIGYIKKWEK